MKLVSLLTLKKSFQNDEAAMRHAGIDPTLPDATLYREHEDGSVDRRFPIAWTIRIVKAWPSNMQSDTVRIESTLGDPSGFDVSTANDAVQLVAGNLESCTVGWTQADADEYNRRWDAGEVDGGVSMSVIEHYADGTTRTLANGEW